MRLVAVDPGLTTGIAYWNDGAFQAWEEDDPMAAVDWIAHLRVDVTICEDFIPRGGRLTWQPDALHIIGALRYFAWTRAEELDLRQASEKSFADDTKLKKAGFYTPGMGHANDAARHLLKGLVRRKLIRLEDIL